MRIVECRILHFQGSPYDFIIIVVIILINFVLSSPHLGKMSPALSIQHTNESNVVSTDCRFLDSISFSS